MILLVAKLMLFKVLLIVVETIVCICILKDLKIKRRTLLYSMETFALLKLLIIVTLIVTLFYKSHQKSHVFNVNRED